MRALDELALALHGLALDHRVADELVETCVPVQLSKRVSGSGNACLSNSRACHVTWSSFDIHMPISASNKPCLTLSWPTTA